SALLPGVPVGSPRVAAHKIRCVRDLLPFAAFVPYETVSRTITATSRRVIASRHHEQGTDGQARVFSPEVEASDVVSRQPALRPGGCAGGGAGRRRRDVAVHAVRYARGSSVASGRRGRGQA